MAVIELIELIEAPYEEIKEAYETLHRDLPRLRRIQDYVLGKHDLPYMPQNANDEYHLLAERSVTNWMPMVVDASAQALFVDNFRHSSDHADFDDQGGEENVSAAWLHWQGSRMDAKQASVFRAALEYGHAFTVTERDEKRDTIRTRGVSPMRAVAMFEDPLADLEPTSGFEIVRWAKGDRRGIGIYHDETYSYRVSFKVGFEDPMTLGVKEHGAKRCPMTRFAVHVDLEGNTVGLIEPLIQLQNRVNQTVFDLLVAQTYTSFEVRTVSGMAPPLKMRRNEEGVMVPELDSEGNPVVDQVTINAQRFLYAEDADTKFGHLPAGDLEGLIKAVELALRQLSAVAQVPPHYMLGQIANVNADGLRAAAESLNKKNIEIASSFGESVERIFRVFAEINGDEVNEDDFGEVIWRDLGNASIAQTADALGKFAEMLGIPVRGLWSRVPGVTRTELNTWERMWREDQRARAELMDAVPDEVMQMLSSQSEEFLYEAGGAGGAV